MRTASLTSMRRAGLDLLVRDGAPHDTIVFLHGIGGRASSFADLMQRWPGSERLIAWDMPGYGGSQASGLAWPTAADYAGRLEALVRELRLDNVSVVGQSLGALIAGSFATINIGIMRRLVLMSPAQGYGVPQGAALTPALAQRVAAFDAEGAVTFAATRAPRLVHQADRKRDITETVRAAMASLTTSGHTQAVRVLASGMLAADLAQYWYPILFINGTEDIVTPPSAAQQLFAELQSRSRRSRVTDRLCLIPNAGHAVYLEQPDAVVSAITDFLREAP